MTRTLFFAVAATVASATNEWSSWGDNKWQKPEKHEVEYVYDYSYVHYCDSGDYHTGSYQCVREQGERDHGLCSFKYVKPCKKEDHGAKLVKRFYKRVYYDTSLENECYNAPHLWYSHYIPNTWHRSLLQTQAQAGGAGGEPMVRVLSTGNSWGNGELPCPPQPHVEYGYDEVYARPCDESNRHNGHYYCVKGEQEGYEGLCRYRYVMPCEGGDKGAKKVRRFFKTLHWDRSFEQDCKSNAHYFGNEWQQQEKWTAPKQEQQWGKQSWDSAPGNDWQRDHSWYAGTGAGSGRRLSGSGNDWNYVGKQQWVPSDNSWQQQQQWSQCNDWQPGCRKPTTPRYEYGYDIEYVRYCDEKDYGEKDAHYACVKGEDDKHGDLCRYSYVKRCERSHPRAKPVKVYWKKVYYDQEFEKDCKDNKHYFTENWGKQENWGKEDSKQEQWQAPKQEWKAPKQQEKW